MYCTQCGNKLKNGDNFCTQCGARQFVATFQIVGTNREYEHNKDEEEVADLIIDDLGVNKDFFKYEKPSKDYLSIVYKNNTLFRLKYTEKARWIKIFMHQAYEKEYSESELFEAQKNKNELYWKSQIHNIFDYKEILLKAIKELDNF